MSILRIPRWVLVLCLLFVAGNAYTYATQDIDLRNEDRYQHSFAAHKSVREDCEPGHSSISPNEARKRPHLERISSTSDRHEFWPSDKPIVSVFHCVKKTILEEEPETGIVLRSKTVILHVYTVTAFVDRADIKKEASGRTTLYTAPPEPIYEINWK